ncbi:hypothetical protein TPSD3_00830 [Thioflexithrix psekupsensis]|uniref:P-type Zn(2+) transporter n=1 Tax=Thioflexithrix psekupsensis TaxID=1570016 RepID=A0A251XCH6_9GAMM|nr:HAD-IC family P-type ATPase [Thioflexithrix psekupsensis]OUD16298.1 hypothetical protein TPSD3_00830 [Thioflexithrix psekupsensis]
MMFPLIPLLIAGIAGTAAYRHLPPEKKQAMKEKTQSTLERLDQGYQQWIRTHVDKRLNTQKREQQLEEFAGEYSEEEQALNRKLGLSVLNVGVATAGALVYPPLLILNAVGLAYLMGPIAYRSLQVLFQEKRLQYRLFAFLGVLANFLAGFYVIGSLFISVMFLAFKVSARSEAYSRQALVGAFALHPPDKVWVWVDGVEVEMAFNELQIGDIVVLSAGQSVPIDGHVVDGAATVDQHRLTGESQPIEKTIGDTVFASTLVLSGKLHVRVEQTGEQTNAAQIAKILNHASQSRLDCAMNSEKLADRLVLPVLGASGLAMLTVGVGGGVAVLNGSFGSTMFFAAPLNMLSYLNLASHQGILIKEGRPLEILPTVDTVVFDKTGTLTQEEPEIGRIYTLGN